MEILIKTYNKSELKTLIQGVSGEVANLLGGGSMDYSEEIRSYKHVSSFQWV